MHQDLILLQPYLQVHHHLSTKKGNLLIRIVVFVLYQKNTTAIFKYIQSGRRGENARAHRIFSEKIGIYTAYIKLHEKVQRINLCSPYVHSSYTKSCLKKQKQNPPKPTTTKNESLGFLLSLQVYNSLC